MNRPTIALAMIVKNEAENLPRLLESVKGCFDEIHITDTGSTDGTPDVAEALGCRVHRFDWVGDFSAARNFSFSHIKTDYVCWLDGDDVLEDREGFIRFRDHVMVLADYWLATYHYSSDANGKPMCSFARERVMRTDRGFRWKYFVHEGVTAESPYGPVRVNFTQAWAVRHMRTNQDLVKDRSRNLSLFEGRKDSLDPRMQYYYGKELFEGGKPKEAIEVFKAVCPNDELELHDRILAHQYCGYAMVQCDQFAQAIEVAFKGLQLAPNRAEFYALIGDCYLKQGHLMEAIPAMSAAKACTPMPSSAVSPIFQTEEVYTSYPRNQLTRIFANVGDLDAAESEAKETVGKFQNQEAQILLKDVLAMKAATTAYKDATPCEDIVITCPPVAPYLWDADVAKTRAMGGSETAAIEMAKWLKQLSGRPVKVFNARDAEKVCDGVEYIPTAKVNEYMANNRPFLHIAWRHTFKITDAPTYVWSHDLTTPGVENHANYDRVLCLTPFHKQYMMATQGVPEHKILVTRNGVDPTRFKDELSWHKDPWKFVFSSSPDRGLDRAMRVLDRVRVKYPQVKLHVYYGIEHLDQYGHAELKKTLQSMMYERRDWVIYHGATQQDELMREFKSAAYCVQPSDWIETSMISARERLYCGVYQIIRAIGGAVDTLAEANASGMAKLVHSECITDAEHDRYAEEVCKAIKESAYLRVAADPTEWSWEGVAKDWLARLPAVETKEVKTA